MNFSTLDTPLGSNAPTKNV